MTASASIRTPDGRTLQVADAGGEGVPLLWQAGSPHTGDLIEPVLAAAQAAGLRLIGWARPGYGASTRWPDRTIGAAAADAAVVADSVGVGRFALAGYSGGGPHALAAAALLPDRVTAVGAFASVAPDTGGDDWLAGMASPAALTAARQGRAAREALPDDFDPESFVAADWAALGGPLAAIGEDAVRAGSQGTAGLVDDDVALARPWGVDLGRVTAPVLLVQGDADRVIPPAHARLLAAAIPHARLRIRPGDGHVSVLAALPEVFATLAAAS